MSEPVFIAQTDECQNATQMLRWWRLRAEEASEESGCTFFRYARHPSVTNWIMIEGWRERPKDQGKPRWVRKV